MAKSKGRQKSKAAQHTHATRDDRAAEKALQDIEDHPEAVAFESRNKVNDDLYHRQLNGPTDAERAKMHRNLIWLAIAAGVPGAFFIARLW
jgi:hypothetical protein